MDGMVLDVTRWLDEHPGGSTIIPEQVSTLPVTCSKCLEHPLTLFSQFLGQVACRAAFCPYRVTLGLMYPTPSSGSLRPSCPGSYLKYTCTESTRCLFPPGPHSDLTTGTQHGLDCVF